MVLCFNFSVSLKDQLVCLEAAVMFRCLGVRMEKINTADLHGFQLHIYQEVQSKLKMAT